MSNQSQEEKRLTLKQKLKLVFDDDLRTPLPHWKNIIDYIIIALIIISALEVFLSTFSSIAERHGTILNFIDKFTVIFFTIEIALRIWTADLLDKRYEGFAGRVRYCCSFYGLTPTCLPKPIISRLKTCKQSDLMTSKPDETGACES